MDNLTPEQRHSLMQRIRSQGTLPERIVMKALKKKKVYFSKNVKTILGKPDIVFRRRRLVVFIDSDFWHGHPKRFILPKSNTLYWEKKIQNNRIRDKLVSRQLRKEGWTVLRFWEHDIRKNAEKVVNKIVDSIRKD